ncbi:MAG: hypothetical protein ACLQDV_28350 [Candidatus Binataceae bacterium]
MSIFRRVIWLLSVVLAAPICALAANAQVQVSQAVQFDVSPPLSELAQRAQTDTAAAGQATTAPPRVIPLNRLPVAQAPVKGDPALQSSANIAQRAQVLAGFQGVGVGLGSFKPRFTPPDTTGAAGATQFVEWVNVNLAVFDKSTGAVEMGPVPGNTLFAGFGGGCETQNDGDPIVEYDKAAGRWVLSQFTSEPPFLECVAVSTTSDATGTYNRYAFPMGANFADYPHVGVWPDGYYFSFNMFAPNDGPLLGGRACVFERSAMLAGQPAEQECFDSATTFGMVPSDWDGATAPPSGAPNYFVQFGSSGGTNLLNVYTLHADFVTPSNATFSAPTQLPVSSFIPACQETEPGPIANGGGDPDSNGKGCIPQKGISQKLDELSDRMMYRAAYRNFGDHESLVATHTVSRVVRGTNRIVVNGASIRWYELRGLSTTPTVFQQGTFGPDPKWRWMPSIGMDTAGDIAVGYSVSSPNMNPGIRFTGRTPSDPSGKMEAEKVILRAKGSQTSVDRWGDYSALSIDPADDCTFWYTTEYMEQTAGNASWSTWIASFKFPSCQ